MNESLPAVQATGQKASHTSEVEARPFLPRTVRGSSGKAHRHANRSEERAAERADRAIAPRHGDLCLARESDVSDRMLMRAMVEQTLSYCSDLPGVPFVDELGLLPLDDPDRCMRETGLSIRQIREPGANAVLFEHQGVLYLYSMGSAAKADGDGDNAFIKILVDVLREFRPRRLRVATFSRLVRAPEFAGELYKAVLDCVEVVLVGALPIDLKTPNGKTMWHVFAMVAAMERDLIVARLIAGMVAKYRRNQWVKGAQSVPPGYVLDPKTDKVALTTDEAEIAAVRELLCLLADHQLTKREILARAGAKGLTTARLKQLHGADATFADSRSPSDTVERLLGWIDVYRRGVAVTTQANAFAGQTHVVGHPVEYVDEFDTMGYLRFEYHWGVPPGGWVDDDILDAAAARAKRPDPTGGKAHRRLGALTGVDWVQDNFRHFLGGAGGEHYHLMREPIEQLVTSVVLSAVRGVGSELEQRATQALLAARRLGELA